MKTPLVFILGCDTDSETIVRKAMPKLHGAGVEICACYESVEMQAAMAQWIKSRGREDDLRQYFQTRVGNEGPTGMTVSDYMSGSHRALMETCWDAGRAGMEVICVGRPLRNRDTDQGVHAAQQIAETAEAFWASRPGIIAITQAADAGTGTANISLKDRLRERGINAMGVHVKAEPLFSAFATSRPQFQYARDGMNDISKGDGFAKSPKQLTAEVVRLTELIDAHPAPTRDAGVSMPAPEMSAGTEVRTGNSLQGK